RAGFTPWLTVVLGMIVAGTFAFLRRPPSGPAGAAEWVGTIVFGIAALVLLLSLLAWAAGAGGGRWSSAEARNLTTGWVRTRLIVPVATWVFALVDTAGQTLYARAELRDGLGALFTAVGGAFGVVAAAASGAMKLLGTLVGPSKRRVPIPATVLAALVALL